jgi:UDP-N-acetylglucosamine--N-acetylmuramyl-(pentapeptide) pyrophosphoryl-undecaprenol N-acetylglucosamine transferase
MTRPFFYEELPHLLAAATLVISRAGANTLWELATSGKPSVLIPLPIGTSRGDQIRNARVFEGIGASVVLPEEEAGPERLLAIVEKLMDNTEILKRMGDAVRRIAMDDARDRIAQELIALLPEKKRGV